jgi:signal transduction histidine kinase
VNDEIGRHIQVLNAMLDRLQASFDQATRFTADASHELRTPLTILRGEIEQALHETRDTPAQERLLSLLEQTSGLQKITDNLLLLARFDAGKLPLQARRFDFSQLVAEAAEDAGMLATSTRLSIVQRFEPGIEIEGDAVLLRRVLLNLVDNAVRYNRPDGEVEMTLCRSDHSAVFKISNTGDGIPADRAGSLFQRFFRASEDRNSAAGGSGLGLSLCREIVTAHRGHLVLAGSNAVRTEFVMRLPAAS